MLNSTNVLEVRFEPNSNRPAKSERFGRAEPNFENISLDESKIKARMVEDTRGAKGPNEVDTGSMQ